MTGLVVILQDEILGATDPHPALAAADRQVERFSAREDWRARLMALDAALEAGAGRAVIFCSLQVARFVDRRCPRLRRGLLLEPEKLRVHRWSGFLPHAMLLNRSFVLIPFGALEVRRGQLEALFGSRIFLRPDSAMKPFPGLAVDLDDLAFELSAIRQTHHVDPDCLCVVDRAQALPRHEHRFWVADGRILSHAAYAFGAGGVDPDHAAPPCPAPVMALAARAAEWLERWENPVVADLVLDGEGLPRVVEINGFSTSGFYPGIDLVSIVAALEDIIIH
jgi:hypothetical protein